MNKEFEDEEIVVYQYYSSKFLEKVRKIYFHKHERMFYEIDPVPVKSVATSEHYFYCACSRKMKCIKSGGEFLKEMSYGVENTFRNFTYPNTFKYSFDRKMNKLFLS